MLSVLGKGSSYKGIVIYDSRNVITVLGGIVQEGVGEDLGAFDSEGGSCGRGWRLLDLWI